MKHWSSPTSVKQTNKEKENGKWFNLKWFNDSINSIQNDKWCHLEFAHEKGFSLSTLPFPGETRRWQQKQMFTKLNWGGRRNWLSGGEETGICVHRHS